MAKRNNVKKKNGGALGGALYFAFGSNLDRQQMRRRCPNAITIGAAWLANHRLAFCGASRSRGAGVATVERDVKSATIGIVYWIPDVDLDVLDRCEGHPWWYRRESMTVRLTEQNRAVRTFVYILRGQPYNPPTAEYYTLIAKAYNREKFNPDNLHAAVARCFRDGKPVNPPPKPVRKPAAPKRRRVSVPAYTRGTQTALPLRYATSTVDRFLNPPRVEKKSPKPLRRVFVYGTLLDGEHNDALLDGAKFIGYDKTRPHFHLADLGAYPAALEGGTTQIRGEIYEVDARTLGELDELEGHPTYYQRKIVTLASGRRAWIYVLPTFRAVGKATIASGDWKQWTAAAAARDAWSYERAITRQQAHNRRAR